MPQCRPQPRPDFADIGLSTACGWLHFETTVLYSTGIGYPNLGTLDIHFPDGTVVSMIVHAF